MYRPLKLIEKLWGQKKPAEQGLSVPVTAVPGNLINYENLEL